MDNDKDLLYLRRENLQDERSVKAIQAACEDLGYKYIWEDDWLTIIIGDRLHGAFVLGTVFAAKLSE